MKCAKIQPGRDIFTSKARMTERFWRRAFCSFTHDYHVLSGTWGFHGADADVLDIPRSGHEIYS